MSPISQGWRATVRDRDWGRFPAHNKLPFSKNSPETQEWTPVVMPGLWDSVHLSQLADAGWAHDTSQASPPAGVFKWELRRENQHLAGGDLFGCEAQVLPVSRSAILEKSQHAEKCKTEQSTGRKDFSAVKWVWNRNNFKQQNSKRTESTTH